jgi:uncharacterized protein YcbK (DUF882 family)
MDAVQRLDRRGFLAAAAAMLATTSAPAFAQTFISDTPSSDVGFSRIEERPAAARAQVAASSAAAAAPPQASAPAAADWRQRLLSGDRTILMRRDGAARRIRYCTADGMLDRDGYAQACLMLRDLRAGKMFPMDPRLLDILCGLQRWGEYNGRSSTILLTSGFRTDETNLATEGAARNSMHRYGRAADIVLEGFSSGLMGAMVREFNRDGGTGIYLSRGFVHVDTGAARSWVSTARPTRR